MGVLKDYLMSILYLLVMLIVVPIFIVVAIFALLISPIVDKIQTRKEKKKTTDIVTEIEDTKIDPIDATYD